jgi:hypothetical protein
MSNQELTESLDKEGTVAYKCVCKRISLYFAIKGTEEPGNNRSDLLTFYRKRDLITLILEYSCYLCLQTLSLWIEFEAQKI